MPRSRKRHEPRHVDPGKPRLAMPRPPLEVALLSVVAVLAVVGAGMVSAGSFGLDDGSRARATSEAAAITNAAPDPGRVTPAPVPGRYEVVSATRLRPVPKAEPERSKLADQVEKAVARPTIDEFGVAMINILGSQHTAGGRGGYGPGVNRAHTATQLLLARGASIVGFSEIQPDQLNVFLNNAPAFVAYPGTSLGSKGVPQSVAWDTRVWELVEATEVYIPFSGQIRPQPVVRLANVASGAEIWVMNVHNSPLGMEGERDRAEAIEIARINELVATGLPIVVTGDFNEKQEVLCRITAATGLASAVGGGNCYPPPQPMRVDWIFASEAFTVHSYSVTRDAPIPSITDHAVLFSRLSLS